MDFLILSIILLSLSSAIVSIIANIKSSKDRKYQDFTNQIAVIKENIEVSKEFVKDVEKVLFSLEHVVELKHSKLDELNLINFQSIYKPKFHFFNFLLKDLLISEYDLYSDVLRDIENIKTEIKFIDNKTNYLKAISILKEHMTFEKETSFYIYENTFNKFTLLKVFQPIFFYEAEYSVIELVTKKIKNIIEEDRNKLLPTKNIVHLADSAKPKDERNK